MRNSLSVITAIALVAIHVWAQSVPSGGALAPAGSFPNSILVEGTPVRMRITRTISSADAEVGQNVDFEVLDTVRVGNIVAIRRGATAIGTITEAQPKRRMGRGGKLNVNIDYVRLTNMEKLPLRGIKEVKGGGRAGAMTGAMVVTGIVFFPAAPLFLFMHGKDITIPKGHEVTVYTNTDYDLAQLVGSPERAAPAATVAQSVPPSTIPPQPAPQAAVAQSALPAPVVRTAAPASARPQPTAMASQPSSAMPAARASGGTSTNVLTNSSVLTLKNAGLSEEVILRAIAVSTANYQLGPDQIVELKQAGLSDAIISAMLQASQH